MRRASCRTGWYFLRTLTSALVLREMIERVERDASRVLQFLEPPYLEQRAVIRACAPAERLRPGVVDGD